MPERMGQAFWPGVLRHPEMVRVVKAVRNSNTDFAVAAVTDNTADLDRPAADYLDAANARHQGEEATDVTFAGIVPLEPDGAIRQITWSVGGGQPATTRASRNSEHAEYLPPYPERRRIEDLRRFLGRARAEELAEQAPGT